MQTVAYQLIFWVFSKDKNDDYGKNWAQMYKWLDQAAINNHSETQSAICLYGRKLNISCSGYWLGVRKTCLSRWNLMRTIWQGYEYDWKNCCTFPRWKCESKWIQTRIHNVTLRIPRTHHYFLPHFSPVFWNAGNNQQIQKCRFSTVDFLEENNVI